jgi:Tfp pilus assembly protein PilF
VDLLQVGVGQGRRHAVGAECAGSPNYAAYHYHLGMAYMASGQPYAAKESLNEALGRDPKFDYATTARAALEEISKGGGL